MSFHMMRSTTSRRVAVSFLVVLAFLGSGAATLSAATPQSAVQPRVQEPAVRPAVWEQPQPAQNEFVPLKNLPQQEQLPAAPLLMGAYAFVWVALIVYVWSLWRRVGRVQEELTELRRQVAARK